MRETKYRGKAVDDGEFVRKGDWVYGSLINNIYFEDTKEPIPFILTTDYCERCFNSCDDNEGFFGCDDAFVKVDPETVGQYMGLNDKDGTNRFEGDYLGNWADEQWETFGYIKYCDESDCMEAGRYYLADKDGNVSEWWDGDWSEVKHLEVIGNIHDNPELLNV